MKIISSTRNVFYGILCVICIGAILFLYACYSFTGGSIPGHLKTLYIAAVEDNSGFGSPQYRDVLTREIFEKFREDNSFTLVESGGDARLDLSISSINDAAIAVSPDGRGDDLESERKITVTCSAEYFDAVKKKLVWKKSFSNYGTYEIANAQEGRDEVVSEALKQTADDVVLAIVSGW